jgi:hypothetical protein
VSSYHRYRIQAQPAPHLDGHPSRFTVEIDRINLAKLFLRELVEHRGNLPVVLSRPCVYGVFSGPIGGFLPREQLCVGCLRCTVEHPEIVTIRPNPKRLRLGDSFVSANGVDTIMYEAATGRVPVKGAGYRGAFGGAEWDSMWTDMSEIVRPTRDGIHGREFISTSVDIGFKPTALVLDGAGQPIGETPRLISLPVPFLFETPVAAAQRHYLLALEAAALEVQSLLLLPLETVLEHGMQSPAIAPTVGAHNARRLDELTYTPRLIELDAVDPELERLVAKEYPEAILGLRLVSVDSLPQLVDSGYSVFHLVADHHGRLGNEHMLDAIQRGHRLLLEAGTRETVTLLGSGGITAAEHVPKAIIAGLDAVALDVPLLLAVQARIEVDSLRPERTTFELPAFDTDWGGQRLVNLIASWRDQLLEILGAMGIREVRRLRGEVGRAMFQSELEREAFAGIEGYPNGQD